MGNCIEVMERAFAEESKEHAIRFSRLEQPGYMATIIETCKKRGLGRELPTEWFGADLNERTIDAKTFFYASDA